MSKVSIATVMVVALLSPLRITGQNQQTSQVGPSDWWINIPSSPLIIETNVSGRMLNLFNHSSKSIKRYRLGCIVETGGKLKIVHKKTTVKTNLAPNQGLLNSIYVYSQDRLQCRSKHAKLSVIEVKFLDGSEWKAK
jgi:hypothetical protein